MARTKNGSRRRILMIGVACIAPLATMSWSPAPAAAEEVECEICHYWSYAACMDTCEGLTGDAKTACENCCFDSCFDPEWDDMPVTDLVNSTPRSPIVIALGQGPPRFTSAENGVRFDLDADGEPEAISWTDPASSTAFLVLDRDFDGRIDSGLELFGDGSPQPPSDDPHGFRALAVFDGPGSGGNGDGAISSTDAVWTSLRLWLDGNHDGVSDPHELAPLGDHLVLSIDLSYHESRRRDRFGNELRYQSRVTRDGASTHAVDVFLLRH